MNLNELRDKAYQCAIAHGWHEEEHSNDHWLCLIISELMEAVQADRKGKYANVVMFKEWQGNSLPLSEDTQTRRFKEDYEAYIKDTLEDELSDAAIRLLDLAGIRNLNLNRFALVNVVSKKKIFTENIYSIIKDIINYKYSLEDQVNYAITQVFALANILGIDLLWHIEQKMEYNKYREYKHGKRD